MSDKDGADIGRQQFRDDVLKNLKTTLSLQRKSVDETDANPKDAPSTRQVDSLDKERKRLSNLEFEEEIDLKRNYGKWFLFILGAQLLLMNMVFIANGFNWLYFKDSTLQIYMAGTLTEVFGLVLVVTKYLFKKK